MGTKVTSSSGSVLEEPEIQKLQMQAKIFKENSLNKLNALKSTTQLLERQSILYQQAFAQLFGDSVRTFNSIPYDNSDHANRFAPEREETMTLENESRSKLDKETVKPYDYTRQNSLYEIFKGPSLEYLYQLERGKEVRKTMWRKPFG
ncbi:hypothetical protein Tco_1144399 [Tanacetum coccineum]